MAKMSKIPEFLIVALTLFGVVGTAHAADNDTLSSKWTSIYFHDFRKGAPVGGKGWGKIKFVRDGLRLSPGKEPTGVYFFPFKHPNEWMMTTKFKFVTKGSEAQLLTRDSSKLNAESGIVLYHWLKNQGSVRQMIHKKNKVMNFFYLPFDLKLNHWYTMTFVYFHKTVKGYVNGVLRVKKTGVPAFHGVYTEPHFSAQHGTVIFQNVRIFKRAKPGK